MKAVISPVVRAVVNPVVNIEDVSIMNITADSTRVTADNARIRADNVND